MLNIVYVATLDIGRLMISSSWREIFIFIVHLLRSNINTRTGRCHNNLFVFVNTFSVKQKIPKKNQKITSSQLKIPKTSENHSFEPHEKSKFSCQSWFYCRICRAHIKPYNKNNCQTCDWIVPVDQKHNQNLQNCLHINFEINFLTFW